MVSNLSLRLGEFAFLPFCLLSGGIKIVFYLQSGDHSGSKFAFLPFFLSSRGVRIVSNLRSGGLRLSKFAFLPFCFLSRRYK